MKKFIAIILANLFLGSQLAFAIVDKPVNALRFGMGQSADNPTGAIPYGDLSNYIVLQSSTVSTTTNGFYAFVKMSPFSASSPYQVTSNKTFIVLGAYINSSVTGAAIALCTGTAAVTEGGSAPTGVVYGGAGSNAVTIITNGTANVLVSYPGLIMSGFPQNTYPCLKWFGSASGWYNVTLIGKEI